ncbi:anticodon-binding aminoacyl-tRNA synthetase, class 1a [Tanacetum coccineum]
MQYQKHSYQKSLHRPQLRISSTSPVIQIAAKLYVTTNKVRDVETSSHIDDDHAHVDVHDDDYVIDDATVALYRENAEKNLDVFDLFDNISTSEIEAAAREKPDIDINNEAFLSKDSSLAMFYLALKNAVDVDLKVEFLAPSMETKVYGSVVAYFGKNFEYSDFDDLYYLTLFKKKHSAFVGPGSLHLMRSALAVPANSSLIIKANLFDNTSENEILLGTCEITVGLDGKPTVGSIVSKDYSLSILVNWKLPSEELKIPSSPICHPTLASNSIVSRLTKRIKFGAHSTSSMAGHSTFSMTDPDERNRWSLQEELENVFNASLKRVFNLQEVVSWSISTCTKEDGGDYLCSGVMHIWPELRKARSYRGPKRAGLALKNIMESEYNDMMESCVVCGPGFVKFKLSRKWIAEGIHRILTAGIDTWAPKLTVKKTVIYCLSQNGGEEMHMGHLRSTIIGETLARVLHHCGVFVILKRIIDKDLPNHNYLDIKLKMMMEFLIERKGQAIGELEVLYNESKKMFDEDAGFRDRANVSQDKSSYTTTMRDTIELMMVTEGDKAVTEGPNSPLVDLRALRHALVEEKADWVVHVTDEGKRVSIEMCIIAEELQESTLKNDDERELGLHLLGFSEVLEEVCTLLTPHILCQYVYELCVKFDSLETSAGQDVMSSEETSNLLLCEATEVVMRKCFYLLGITPICKT